MKVWMIDKCLFLIINYFYIKYYRNPRFYLINDISVLSMILIENIKINTPK